MKSIRARLQRDERGVAALEFALVSLLLLMLVFGIITFGFVFALDNNLGHAASEGARAAISKANTTATDAQIELYAENTTRERMAFQVAKDYAVIDAVVAGCSLDPSVSCITVTVEFDYSTHPIVPRLFGVGIPDKLHADAVVQLD